MDRMTQVVQDITENIQGRLDGGEIDTESGNTKKILYESITSSLRAAIEPEDLPIPRCTSLYPVGYHVQLSAGPGARS